jgi:hypothetical protein
MRGVSALDRLEMEERYRRAVVLIQLLINLDAEAHDDAEDDARAQLEAWGVKVPERRDGDYDEAGDGA